MKKYYISILVLAHLCTCAELKLAVQPELSSGLPGELQQVDLCIEMPSPRKAVLRVPHASNLVLRAVERYPVSRTPEGFYVQKRQLVFQGVEAGVTVFTNLLVEIGSEIHCFPPVTINVLKVEKAEPPKEPVKKREKDSSSP